MSEEWSQYVFGLVGWQTLQYVITFVVIFSLMSIVVVLLRRRVANREEAEMPAGQRGRKARLGIVDVYEMDAQRRLILLRRDGVEHLLLVGGPNDLVIERHIERGAGIRPDAGEVYRDERPRPSRDASPRQGTRTDPTFPAYLPAPSAPVATHPDLPGVDLTKRDPESPTPPTVDPAQPDLPFPAVEPGPATAPKTDRDLLSGMAEQLEAALLQSGDRPDRDRKPDVASSNPAREGRVEPAGPSTGMGDASGALPRPDSPSAEPVPDRSVRGPAPSKGATLSPDEFPGGGRSKGSPDVFSIQEIEDEFARLLGRRPDRAT